MVKVIIAVAMLPRLSVIVSIPLLEITWVNVLSVVDENVSGEDPSKNNNSNHDYQNTLVQRVWLALVI